MEIQMILAIIEQAVKGLDITSDQKDMLLGMYFAYIYRSIFEIVIGLKSTEKNFYMELNNSILSLVNTLNSEQKKTFEQIFQKEKTRILVEVLGQFKDKLEPEMKTKVENNIENMISNIPSSTK